MVTGPIVRLIGSGIGLASEAVAAHKQGKAKKSQGQEKPQAPSPHSGNDSESPVYAEVDNQNEADELVARGQAAHTDFEEPPPNYDRVVHDEEDWELDAAAEEAVGRDTDTENDDGTKLDLRKITQHFIERHPLPSGGHHAQGKLPCPVIIPQQRPRTKARGFVNAYAPVLENCGVDQKTFIDFLKTFHKASQASQTFKVLFVAGHIIGYAPDLAAQIISFGIQTTATVGMILQSRSRTNTFLDDVNEHYYKPRGLYALLMMYKPSSRNSWSSGEVDISQTLTKQHDMVDHPSKKDKMKHNLQFAAAKTYTEDEMPYTAPLIYPALDELVEDEANPNKPSKKPNFFKEKTAFYQDYQDRVGQARFNAEAPDSSLQVEQPKFANRFADPNHPARSGGLINLISGGKIDRSGMRLQKDDAKKERRGFYGPLGALRHYQPLRRVMREGILYLMIVNMPSEEEMNIARAEMEKAEQEKKEKKAHKS